LLFRWLDELEYVENITIMLQKEVAERICAIEASKKYGKLSVMCQLVAETKKLFDVPKEAFFPPPKVTSSIVQLTPKKLDFDKDIIEIVRKITHYAFIGRRKMIKKSLESLSPNILDLLEKASINPMLRAENLSVEDYKRLAELVMQYHHP
jgi:16S rRNA (adenine1518-N6/adenine1519-N6)-dimethyltransferase